MKKDNIYVFLSFVPMLILIAVLWGIIYIEQNPKHKKYTITSDTNVSRVKGLSKYVTGEEIDDFAFRYWDIDNNHTEDIKPQLLNLRTLLKQKDTDKILFYIKDNNLSVDVKIENGTTPLMYSSFYNDENTSKELIKLGANVHAKDEYGLSPLAYAIENNSVKSAKVLVDSGVKFEEIDKVQIYLYTKTNHNIKKVEIDENNNTKIYYKRKDVEKNTGSKDGTYFVFYLTFRNFTDMLNLALKSGYKVSKEKWHLPLYMPAFSNLEIAQNTEKSPFSHLIYTPNYKPLLELLLKYDIFGKPNKEELRRAYEYCHEEYNGIIKFYQRIDKKYSFKSLDEEGKLGRIVAEYRINNHKKYCKDKNGTFNVRGYFDWANKKHLLDNVDRLGNKFLINSSLNKQNNTKE